jgi:hypothetical protein
MKLNQMDKLMIGVLLAATVAGGILLRSVGSALDQWRAKEEAALASRCRLALSVRTTRRDTVDYATANGCTAYVR